MHLRRKADAEVSENKMQTSRENEGEKRARERERDSEIQGESQALKVVFRGERKPPMRLR